MKATLSFLLAFVSFTIVQAQAPTISGDTILCPWTDGTASITTDQAYDSYTWYYKYWFTEDPFTAIDGANGPSFTYDWYTYDQALLKVVVTLNGETFESNTIQIDSYNWLPISTGFSESENISINPDNGNVMLCEGTSFPIEVFNPFSENIRWYRDGELLEGENSMTLVVSQPGAYHVEASPGVCPENTSSTEGLPIIVEIDTTCNLGINNPQELTFTLSPNPAIGFATINSDAALDKIKVYNIAGQLVLTQKPVSGFVSIDVSHLQSGLYILEAFSGEKSKKVKLVID